MPLLDAVDGMDLGEKTWRIRMAVGSRERSHAPAVPPCVWGERSGYNGELQPVPSLGGVPLRLVKRCNATYGHHGEMAHGQIFYAAE